MKTYNALSAVEIIELQDECQRLRQENKTLRESYLEKRQALINSLSDRQYQAFKFRNTHETF